MEDYCASILKSTTSLVDVSRFFLFLAMVAILCSEAESF